MEVLKSTGRSEAQPSRGGREALKNFISGAGVLGQIHEQTIGWANQEQDRVASAITTLAYNKFYALDEENVLALPDYPRVRTLVYGKGVPWATFGVDEERSGLSRFFEIESLDRSFVELVRFAYHPEVGKMSGEKRLLILRQMFEFVQDNFPERRFVLIMPPLVRDFVVKTGFPVLPLSLPEKFTKESNLVRIQWSKYWQPFGEPENRPQAYELVVKKVENKYLNYPNRPVNLGFGKAKKVAKNHRFSRVKTAIDGLLEDLVPGSLLANEFASEILPAYGEALGKDVDFPPFGEMFFYPDRGDLVSYLPKKWHETALLTRNSLLLRDQKQTISWEKQREIFGRLVIGVVGASVGKNVFLALANFLVPRHLKIADLRNYKDTNASRTAISYWEIGKNKAEVAAAQVHANNPYLPVSVYPNGLNEENQADFIVGNDKFGEPKLDYLIEETDDPDAKISGRIWARKHGVPVIMVTDIGTAYQIDFRDFRTLPTASLAVGVSDRELLAAQEEWHRDKANRELFFKFAFKLIGEDWRQVPEFADLVLKKLVVPFGGGIPQLGVAAFKGAADVALLIGMNELGYEVKERVFIDSRKALQR